MAEGRVEAPFVPGAVPRVVRGRVPVPGAEAVAPQGLAFGRLVAGTTVPLGDVLDLVASDRLVEVGGAAVGVHDRLEVRARAVEERREAEAAGVREVLPFLERSLHLPDARREQLGAKGPAAELGTSDRRRRSSCELGEKLGLSLSNLPHHVVGERERFGEPKADRLLQEARGPRRTDDHRPAAHGLARKTELGLPDRNRKTQVVDQGNLDPLRGGVEAESKAAGDLRELLRGDDEQSRVVPLRLGDRPSSQGGRRRGGREDHPGEQEREQPNGRVGARELLEIASSARVLRRREDAGATERPSRRERGVREERADRDRLFPEERFCPWEERVLAEERALV
jgi:hypothetical protein